MESHSHPEIIQMQVQILEIEKKVNYHDQILVTGSDGQLSLPETVRSLAKTVEDYINQRNKEEEQRKKELVWWKRAIVGVVLSIIVPGVVAFIWQVILFYVKVVPAIDSMLIK